MELLEFIESRERVLLDGAMGTQLGSLGSHNPGGWELT
jgi:hypothetical protein